MSLDIELTSKDGITVADMNWLRNPFGLANWAEDNVGSLVKIDERGVERAALYYVCNEWSYSDSHKVDRDLFKRVVMAYWDQIKALEQAYYYFSLPSYRQFVEGKAHLMPGEKADWGENWSIEGSKYDPENRLMIPCEHFADPVFNMSKPSTETSKAWFEELVRFADLLQDTSNEFYCSN